MHLSCREWRSRCLFPNRRRRLSRCCHVCFVRRTNHSHRTPFYVSYTTCKLPAVKALPACLEKHTAKLSLRILGRPADAYHIFHDGPNIPSSPFGIAFDSDPASMLPSHLNLLPSRVLPHSVLKSTWEDGVTRKKRKKGGLPEVAGWVGRKRHSAMDRGLSKMPETAARLLAPSPSPTRRTSALSASSAPLKVETKCTYGLGRKNRS